MCKKSVGTVWAVYFSATGGTRTIVNAVAHRLAQQAGVEEKTCDFTLPQARKTPPEDFGPGDLVVFGTPVYAGRVPNLLLPFVSSVWGHGARAVPVVCYGNRSFDDALMELCLTLEAGGFETVAAGAFVCQHSFSQTQAAGRPDVSDRTIASGFADRVWQKLCSGAPTEKLSAKVTGANPVGPYYTPRDRQGNPVNILKVTPKTNPETCLHCGKCARLCPLGSIDPEAPERMRGKCMKCNRCVKCCPSGAKFFDDAAYLYHKTELEAQYSWPRREPALFL